MPRAHKISFDKQTILVVCGMLLNPNHQRLLAWHLLPGVLVLAFTLTAWKTFEDVGPVVTGDGIIRVGYHAGVGKQVLALLPEPAEGLPYYDETTVHLDFMPDKGGSINKAQRGNRAPAASGTLPTEFSGHKAISRRNSIDTVLGPMASAATNLTKPTVLPGGVDIGPDVGGAPSSYGAGGMPHGPPLALAGSPTCTNAVRLHCGQFDSGNNFSQDTTGQSFLNCMSSSQQTYRGPVWYRVGGTGGLFSIRAAATGNMAQMQVYRAGLDGSCDSLFCVGGADSINFSARTVTFWSTPGREYYIMLGQDAFSTSVVNMFYTIEFLCFCNDVDLFFTPPNHFLQGDSFNVRVDTSSKISASIIVGTDVNLEFSAGTAIELNPGFQVNSGANFTAIMGGCSQFSSLRIMPPLPPPQSQYIDYRYDLPHRAPDHAQPPADKKWKWWRIRR